MSLLRIVRPGITISASLTAAALLCANIACAQQLRADIASVDRSLVGDASASRALQEGRVEDAADMLRSTLAANPADTLAHQLLCRVFYAQDRTDEASREFAETAALAPSFTHNSRSMQGM